MAIGASASMRDEVIDQLVALHVAADPGPGFPRLSMREAGASSSQAAGPRPSRQNFFAQRNFCEKGGGLRPAMPDPAPFSPVYSDEGNQGRGDQHGG